MNKNSKIYVAGHSGLVGSAILKKLKEGGYENIITISHQKLDLTRQSDVESFFKIERPQYVILCAAKVGGIGANISYPAQFIYENLAIQINVIHSACQYGIEKLLFFGSACSYPHLCPQPIKEECLLSGYIEPTNEAYAIAKISGIKMCQAYNLQYGTNFICAIPTNTYGPNDDFAGDNSHVIPALIRKFYEAKINKQPTVTVWGTGNPVRDFIYIDDLASACLFLMNRYNETDIINISTGKGVSIKELASIIKDIVEYSGKIVFDTSKPNGASIKILDVSRLKGLGWLNKIELEDGIRKTYEWYTKHLEEICVNGKA